MPVLSLRGDPLGGIAAGDGGGVDPRRPPPIWACCPVMHSLHPGFCCHIQHISAMITELWPPVIQALHSNISTLVRHPTPSRQCLAPGTDTVASPLLPGTDLAGALSPPPHPLCSLRRPDRPGCRDKITAQMSVRSLRGDPLAWGRRRVDLRRLPANRAYSPLMHSPNPGFCCLLQHVSSIITRLLPLVTPALDSNISTLVRGIHLNRIMPRTGAAA